LLGKGKPKSNVDGSNTREMASLQGHLSSPLTNQVGADGTHRGQGALSWPASSSINRAGGIPADFFLRFS